MLELMQLAVNGVSSGRSDLLRQAVEEFDADGDCTAGDFFDAEGLVDLSKFDAQGHRDGRHRRPENRKPAMEAAKELLENAVSRVESTDGRFAQILVSGASGTPQARHRPYAEGNVVAPGTRVREVVLDDGTALVQTGVVVPNAAALNSATTDFLVRGGDQYSFLGVPCVTLGVTHQQALRSDIEQGLSGLITAAQYPERGEGCIVTVE